jgi:hypothetical protein
MNMYVIHAGLYVTALCIEKLMSKQLAKYYINKSRSDILIRIIVQYTVRTRSSSFSSPFFFCILCTVHIIFHTLQRQFRLYIPFLGIARLQPQFLHSCVCERFIYSQDRSTYFLQQKRQLHRGNTYIIYIYNLLTDT